MDVQWEVLDAAWMWSGCCFFLCHWNWNSCCPQSDIICYRFNWSMFTVWKYCLLNGKPGYNFKSHISQQIHPQQCQPCCRKVGKKRAIYFPSMQLSGTPEWGRWSRDAKVDNCKIIAKCKMCFYRILPVLKDDFPVIFWDFASSARWCRCSSVFLILDGSPD